LGPRIIHPDLLRLIVEKSSVVPAHEQVQIVATRAEVGDFGIHSSGYVPHFCDTSLR
jgi:hypothetical protein